MKDVPIVTVMGTKYMFFDHHIWHQFGEGDNGAVLGNRQMMYFCVEPILVILVCTNHHGGEDVNGSVLGTKDMLYFGGELEPYGTHFPGARY